MKEQLDQILRDLPDDPDEIAHILTDAGIKATRPTKVPPEQPRSDTCAMTLYLRKTVDVSARAGMISAFVNDDGLRTFVPMPEGCRKFIVRFDKGLYDGLLT